MSALSELLVRANANGLSARSIARQAQEAGFKINHDTAARYLRGDHGRPDEETLQAFANVLPVRLSELRAAARLPAEETEPYRPPVESSRLNRRQRRAVDEIIRAMLEPSARQVTELGNRQKPARSTRGEASSDRNQDKPRQSSPRAARRGGTEPPAK
jgi:transcriptional regulator with XRE-family HTH domain